MQKESKMSLRMGIMLFLIIAACLGLGARLFYMQIIRHEYFLSQVIGNVKQTTNIAASRGNIYDRNMQRLAANATTWRVFVSPFDIQQGDYNKEDDHYAALISGRLSEILEVDEEAIFERTQMIARRDETIARDVEREQYYEIREFIEEYSLSRMIYLEPTSTRYYPLGSLASQVIGVMGTDRGLFGLEAYYNDRLSGTDGRFVRARDGRSRMLPTRYELEIAAVEGLSLVTTIDVGVQQVLEAQLRATHEANHARNGVAGLIMDVNTGAILAMANYPTFDLNNPFELVGRFATTLENSGYESGTEEYRGLRGRLVQEMWQNKNVTDTYEPGSTFKTMTYAMALESLPDINVDTMFNCTGRMDFPGARVNCHRVSGHGQETFSRKLQVSCNPATMQIAARLGRDLFWQHFVNFGFTERTGIDLPGEALGIFHTHRGLNEVELAVSSFGQTFRTTTLQQLAATAAVANGGWVIQPHIVSELRDSNGNVVYSFDATPRRQILTEEVCRQISLILQENATQGTARNTYLLGYSISAKTGTSEVRDTVNPETGEFDFRIGSAAAFAPTENPQIAILIMVDRPDVPRNQVFGSIVASPYIRETLGQVLPILGVERWLTDADMRDMTMQVDDFVGRPVEAVRENLNRDGITAEVRGEGTTVVRQFPAANSNIIREGARVVLFTDDIADVERVVPIVTGSSVTTAMQRLTSEGFNVQIRGSLNIQAGSGAIVTGQSITGGTRAPVGSVIEINVMHTDVGDGT